MKRIAVFVEGYTEVLFVSKLLEEIAGEKRILIEQTKIRGGANVPKAYSAISARKIATDELFYVLIYDCGGDKLVYSRIREEHEKLSRAGYSKIIGVRDVRPDFTREEIGKLELGLRTYIKTSLIPVEFVLGVMELEAWFLAEYSHFQRIDPSLTLDAVNLELAIDVSTDDVSQIERPAEEMQRVYQLVGKDYVKGDARSTTSVLDYAHIYLDMRNRFPHLNRLVASIDEFLS